MATVTPAAAAQYERIQALQAVAMAAARRRWRRIDPRYIRQSWARTVTETIAPLTTTTMAAAALAGAEYGVMDLAQRGEYVAPIAFVNPAGFASTAPSGVPLETALAAPAVRTLGWIKSGVAEDQALAMGGRLLDGMMRTFVTDTARQAASVDIVTRPGMGYVRMLNPPSCSSCVVLAGRFYRWNAGFMRHPRCDCIHRPVQSLDAAKAEGLVDDPYEYFSSLSQADQDRIFTHPRAQAIRDGADIYRVENSWRGRSKDGLTTSEGTSRRGFAASVRGRRLTPDGIYKQAATKEEALRLLEENGYITRAGQVPGGAIRGPNYEGFGQLGRGGTRVGASAAVRAAQTAGVRQAGDLYTATAAEARLIRSRQRFEAALAGTNPYGKGPATPAHLARAELDYRRWLASGGEIYTS